MDDRIGDDHLRVKKRMRRQLPMEIPAVPIGPVDHRGDREDLAAGLQRLCIHGKPFIDRSSYMKRLAFASFAEAPLPLG